MSTNDRVTLERDGHVLLIGVNRPQKRNAFDLATIDAFAAAYEQLGRQPLGGALPKAGNPARSGLAVAIASHAEAVFAMSPMVSSERADNHPRL